MAALTALGHFEVRDLAAIQGAAAELGIECTHLPVHDATMDWLETSQPAALVVQAADERALQLSAMIRLREQLADLPMLGVHGEPSTLEFTRALTLGLDDLVEAGDSHGLVTRLRAAILTGMESKVERHGRALVFEADELRRPALLRALRAAGYENEVTEDLEAFRNASAKPGIALLALSLSGDVESAGWLAEGRTASSAPCVVSVEPRREAELAAQLAGTPRLRVLDSSAPPENVIFIANELENPQVANKRSAPRELYGASVRFRVAGQDNDDIGFTYNVSADGLFVRTLALPSRDDVWLELTAPRSAQCVRLEGQVMWRRPFRVATRATVPPGFGVRLTDATRACLGLWREGCALPPSVEAIKPRR